MTKRRAFLVRVGNYCKPGSNLVKIQAESEEEAETIAMKRYPQYDDIRVIRQEPIFGSRNYRY